MSNDIKLHNTIRDIMCSRCMKRIRKICFEQPENDRYEQLCICITKILEPNDENYPVELRSDIK